MLLLMLLLLTETGKIFLVLSRAYMPTVYYSEKIESGLSYLCFGEKNRNSHIFGLVS